MRLYIPLVVVPNPDLAENHQVQLAKKLEELEYIVYGKLGSVLLLKIR